MSLLNCSSSSCDQSSFHYIKVSNVNVYLSLVYLYQSLVFPPFNLSKFSMKHTDLLKTMFWNHQIIHYYVKICIESYYSYYNRYLFSDIMNIIMMLHPNNILILFWVDSDLMRFLHKGFKITTFVIIIRGCFKCVPCIKHDNPACVSYFVNIQIYLQIAFCFSWTSKPICKSPLLKTAMDMCD